MVNLVDNELVSYVRVVDKVPPQTAWLNAKHQQVFDNPLVEFRSANLINTGTTTAMRFLEFFLITMSFQHRAKMHLLAITP